MQSVTLSYTQLKDIVVAKSLVYQYTEDTSSYTIFAVEGTISWETRILKDSGANQTDFETNYKTGANAKLYLPISGLVTATAPTYTAAQTNPLSLDTSGNLRVVSHADTSSGSAPSSNSISDYVSANKVFVTAFNVNQPTAGTDNPLLYIRNPTGSGKTLYIYKIGLGINVANVFSNFKLYVDPTVSANGTSQAATSLNIGGSSPAASMLVTSTPTASANGTIIESWQGGQNTNSISFIEDFSIHIAANHSMLITGNPSSNNREAAITLVWVEV